MNLTVHIPELLTNPVFWQGFGAAFAFAIVLGFGLFFVVGVAATRGR